MTHPAFKLPDAWTYDRTSRPVQIFSAGVCRSVNSRGGRKKDMWAAKAQSRNVRRWHATGIVWDQRQWAQPGNMLVVLIHEDRSTVMELLESLRICAGQSRQPLDP